MEANSHPEEKEKVSLDLKTAILIASLVVNIVSASFIWVIFLENRSLTSEVAYYENLSDFYFSLVKSEGLVNSSINIVGVEEKYPYEGVVMVAKIELRIGEGISYVSTQPAKIGTFFQESFEMAIRVAENTLHLSLENIDVLLTIKSGEEIDSVDGPSAGAAITVALMAAIKNQTINNKVYITGEIDEDGTIGRVGRLLEKALAVAENGAEEFLVPPGQSTVNGIIIEEHLRQNGYSNVVVTEVSTIEQAYQKFT